MLSRECIWRRSSSETFDVLLVSLTSESSVLLFSIERLLNLEISSSYFSSFSSRPLFNNFFKLDFVALRSSFKSSILSSCVCRVFLALLALTMYRHVGNLSPHGTSVSILTSFSKFLSFCFSFST